MIMANWKSIVLAFALICILGRVQEASSQSTGAPAPPPGSVPTTTDSPTTRGPVWVGPPPDSRSVDKRKSYGGPGGDTEDNSGVNLTPSLALTLVIEAVLFISTLAKRVMA